MAKKMLRSRVLVVMTIGAIFGGCGFCLPCGNPCQLLTSALVWTGMEFVTDNDAVFDLFQDDFGTGAEYDDRNIGLLGGVPSRDEPLP